MVLFGRCSFDERLQLALTSLTNALRFLWLLHNKSHPLFHQLKALNVKQWQQDVPLYL